MRQEAFRFIPDTAVITTSTYRFQKTGLSGEVAKALCSTSSITMLAMTAETGEPIAVPKNLLMGSPVLYKLRGFEAER